MKKFNKVKEIKRASRSENNNYGKSGAHCDKRERRDIPKKTDDYLDEVEEEIEPSEDNEQGEM